MKLRKISACVISLSMMAGVVPGISASAVYTPQTSYEYQTDTQDDIFQYHFAGGTDAFMNGTSSEGRRYDAYLWVPQSVSPGELKGLIAVKANLIEVPFVYSSKLKAELEKRGFGILWLVFEKDITTVENGGVKTETNHRYNTTFQSFNTRKDYKGDTLCTADTDFTDDGKDAADILNDILSGIAAASGYSEIADKTPLITIGHSAASPFGYRSGNWNPDRIIAQVHMKNGMGGDTGQVPGIPSLQYAAQYTEHDINTGRDRSVVDARYHIANKRNNTNMLVSHIIEWGSGHYDWSDNATDMLIKYIGKAIDYRLPADYSATHKLNDLTNTGYLMKPFVKQANGTEQTAGYYQEHSWLSDGQMNSGASEADKKSSFWFFDKELADEINAFTSYAIPPSPGTNDTKVSGNTYSAIEPYMLMKNPAESTHADTPKTAPTVIAPYLNFTGGMSRYGSNRFVDYEKLANPSGAASNSANLQGYDTATVDTYYMSKIPSIEVSGTSKENKQAYDGNGNEAYVPQNTKAEFVPLMAPYEIVKSEIIPTDGMTRAEGNSEAENVASVTRTTLRFHNNRVYHRAGCYKTNEYGTQLDSFAMILSPEIRNEKDVVTSAFKSTGVQMNVPFVNTGKGTDQTLTLKTINNINITDENVKTTFDVSYTSSDSDLQKYTDVFVEYGPAQAVRTVNPDDGSYSWQIEVLKDEIPENAVYPIEVNVVASNLGKWEKVSGAVSEQKFYITDKNTLSGIHLDGVLQTDYDAAVSSAKAESGNHTITVYSNQDISKRSDMTGSENITFVNGDFAAEVKQTSNNMMFLNTTGASSPILSFGKQSAASTVKDTALIFNANGKGRFAEINKGSFNIYNGVIIKGGNAARGGGIDCKTGSTLNIHGGIITGNKASGTLGGGGVSVVGYGVANMYSGVITANTSDGSYGGGVSVMENGSFNMSGGTITGNTGYDVYVNNNNMKISGSAKIGSLYIASGKTITVDAPFTTDGSHAKITPGAYAEGTELVKYSNEVMPSRTDFTVAPDGETAWYTYVDGQSLKLTQNAPYAVTAQNVSVDKTEAAQGETVTVTVPSGYVENSLVVSGINPNNFTSISDTQYSFKMPSKAVTASCLVNNEPNKTVVVGVHDTYFTKKDEPMNVSFNIPDLENGYIYKSAEINIPARANTGNAVNMTASMNGTSYNVLSGSVSGTAAVNAGAVNVMTITNDGSSGVDYYSYIGGYNGTGYDYPKTAADLSTVTLTRAVSAAAEKITAEGIDTADVNSDAAGYYIESLKIPSWNPPLKWCLEFTGGKKAEKAVDIPELTGGGSISFGIILFGKLGDYKTSDIEGVSVVE